MLQQIALNFKNQHLVWYESELWNEQETRYDAEKWECKDLMKTLKKIRYWLYDMKFIIEIDVNTLIMQLNKSASDLSEALMTWWFAWIRLFDFDVHHVFNCKHSTLDKLLHRFRESTSYSRSSPLGWRSQPPPAAIRLARRSVIPPPVNPSPHPNAP